MAEEMVFYIDLATGEAVERPATPEELAYLVPERAERAALVAARKEAEDAAIAARESARAKLAALGLTEEEISAIVG